VQLIHNERLMSDFLAKFKGIFVVDDGTSSPTKPAVEVAPTQTQAPAQTHTPAAPAPTNVYAHTSGKSNERFQDILLTALEKNNQAGFDYFEFRESMRNLEKMPLDEKTRFQSAFAMAQTMGATPANLQASAQFYVGILKGELQKFEEAHGQQRLRLIGERESEFTNLEAVIQNKAEQIKQLTQDIEAANQRRAVIKDEIEQATVKIEQTRSDFETTYQIVVSQMQGDMQKMNEYLK
jgi:uncharacterized protein (DUF3084 family)